MRNLIRSPLTWMIVAEFVVVGALVVVAWNVVASANRPVLAPPSGEPPVATDASNSDLPQLPQLNAKRLRGPLPGLSVDPSFWRERLNRLNSDQVYLERFEWQIVHSTEEAVNRYLETVVLPAIRRAEHAGVGVVL